MAGILPAKRGSLAPAISPKCTLLVRPIYRETPTGGAQLACADPDGLAAAILDCIEAGARILNLSLALRQPRGGSERRLETALDHSISRRHYSRRSGQPELERQHSNYAPSWS